MFDYESPIKLIETEVNMQFENDMLKAVQQCGVVVDKSELIKALQYDRAQYEKGESDFRERFLQTKMDVLNWLMERQSDGYGTTCGELLEHIYSIAERI